MKRLPAIILLVLLFQLVLCSATPTISNIKVTPDTNAVTVSYNVLPDAYCWVRYGVAKDTYLWSSVTFSSISSHGICSVPITGLKDSTTYYFLPTARPDADDETNLCKAPGCGAVEQEVTMPGGTKPHYPAAPASVAESLLSEPDTTGYAIVNLVDGGAALNHECAAASNVSAPAGYSWTIKAGQTLTQIIAANQLAYGTIFQVPQGVTCIVKPTGTVNGAGYAIPALPADPLSSGKSIDAPNHRWIIFRTTPGGPADFPPFGVRTGPAFFSHYGGFQSNTANTGAGTFNAGTIFHGYNGEIHHFWIENLKFSVDDTNTTANYDYMMVFGNGEGGAAPPFPKFMVFRGNYFHGPVRPSLGSGVPSVQGVFAGTIQGQFAFVGNYIDNIYYAQGPFGSGIPQVLYFLDCGSNVVCPAGGPALIDNNYLHGMGMSLYVEINNHLDPGPHDFTVTHNTFYWPPDSFSYALAVNGFGCRNQLEYKGMNRSLIAGNYINGQWACANTGTPLLFAGYNTDITVRSNFVTKAASFIDISGTGNGSSIVSYAGSGNRFYITNNLAYDLGRGAYNAGGGGVGTDIVEMVSAASNITFTNNTIGPIDDGGFYYPWIFYSGSGSGPIAGLTIKNNILPFGIANSDSTGGIGIQGVLGGSGALSHPSTPIPSNSVVPINFAGWLATAAGYTDGRPSPLFLRRRPLPLIGMQGASVIAGGTGYPNTGALWSKGCATPPSGSYRAIAGTIMSTTFTSFGSGCNFAEFKLGATGGGNGAILRPAYGLTADYDWSGNTIYCTSYQGKDMTQGICNNLNGSMPEGDVWATGSTTARRMAAAGLVNAAASDYRCVPTSESSCQAGANIAKLESELGIVSHISVATGGEIAMISYMAPDSGVCSVDISPDGGKTWTRHSDTGGADQRSISLPGLLPNTVYQYRLLCYFDQAQPWFSFPSDPSNLATSGTFTTLTAGTALNIHPANNQATKGQHASKKR